MSEPLTLNVPTPEGKELGEQLARFYVTEKCDKGAGDLRCHDCAFRLGSYPNGCPSTVLTALDCLQTGEPFYCHHGVEEVIDPDFGADTKPTRVCAGWALLKRKDGEA